MAKKTTTYHKYTITRVKGGKSLIGQLKYQFDSEKGAFRFMLFKIRLAPKVRKIKSGA